MTDDELKETMRTLARVSGLTLSEERIAADLPAFKGHLAAIARIRKVELPLEAEPSPVFVLEPDRQS